MKEKVSSEMVHKWLGEFKRNAPSESVSFGDSVLRVEAGMLAMKNKGEEAVRFLDPVELGIDWKLSKAAKLLLSSRGEDHFVYVLDPGAKKAVRLDFVFEEDAFGIYSKDYELEEALPEEFCASAIGENLLLVYAKKYVFRNEKDERFSAEMHLGKCTGCAALDEDSMVVAGEERFHVLLNGERAEIPLSEFTEKKLEKPQFGLGKSKEYEWLVVKDEGWEDFCVLISVGEKQPLSYTKFELNPLKGAEPLSEQRR